MIFFPFSKAVGLYKVPVKLWEPLWWPNMTSTDHIFENMIDFEISWISSIFCFFLFEIAHKRTLCAFAQIFTSTLFRNKPSWFWGKSNLCVLSISSTHKSRRCVVHAVEALKVIPLTDFTHSTSLYGTKYDGFGGRNFDENIFFYQNFFSPFFV